MTAADPYTRACPLYRAAVATDNRPRRIAREGFLTRLWRLFQ